MANYRKAYLCICDGQQETMYLNHVAKLIKDFPRKVVKFNTFEDLPHRLEKRYENYDSATVFDFDHNDVEFKRNDAYISDVRRIFGLKSTDDIKNEDVIRRILSQITLDDVKAAIRRAETIRKSKVKADGTKIGNTTIYSNPDFSIHEFLREVLEDTGDL